MLNTGIKVTLTAKELDTIMYALQRYSAIIRLDWLELGMEKEDAKQIMNECTVLNQKLNQIFIDALGKDE